jgi:hypothetical protein
MIGSPLVNDLDYLSDGKNSGGIVNIGRIIDRARNEEELMNMLAAESKN